MTPAPWRERPRAVLLDKKQGPSVVVVVVAVVVVAGSTRTVSHTSPSSTNTTRNSPERRPTREKPCIPERGRTKTNSDQKSCSSFETFSGKAGRRPHIWKNTGAHMKNNIWTRNAMTGNSPHILNIVRKIELHITTPGLDNDLCANICAPSQEIWKCHACHARDTSWQSGGVDRDLRVRFPSWEQGVPGLRRQKHVLAVERTGHRTAQARPLKLAGNATPATPVLAGQRNGLVRDLYAIMLAPCQEIRKCHACHGRDTSWQSDGLPKDLRVRMLSISRGVPRLPRQSASPAIGRTGHRLAGHLARTLPGAQEVARLPRQIVSAVGWTGQRPH